MLYYWQDRLCCGILVNGLKRSGRDVDVVFEFVGALMLVVEVTLNYRCWGEDADCWMVMGVLSVWCGN